MRTAGIVITTLGLIGVAVGIIMNLTYQGLDANIGAGMFFVLGLGVAVIGAILLIIWAIVARAKKSARQN